MSTAGSSTPCGACGAAETACSNQSASRSMCAEMRAYVNVCCVLLLPTLMITSHVAISSCKPALAISWLSTELSTDCQHSAN
jgi:spore maturation protein SpmA